LILHPYRANGLIGAEKVKTARNETPATASRKLSTEELASALRVATQTPRASLCRLGHYMGLRPVKLPNGKLLWDAAEVERLLSGEVL
jgi:hypothetical protein